MSEFLAEAQVLVRPNTAGFRADLQKQLRAATQGVTIPVAITAASTGIATAITATTSLATAQRTLAAGVLDLITEEQVLNSVYGRQAVILDGLTASTLQQAGAQSVLDKANKKSTASLLGAGSAAGRLDAGLLALRTAVGSTAVIGLGALALAGIVAGKALRAAVGGAAALEQELNFFKATANATVAEMENVSAAATALGRDTSLPAVSAVDAAQALTNLARAGLEVEDAISGARGTLQLSAAAQISVADATTLTASALNTFNLAGEEATHVADLLTGASLEAQGEISDMGIALQQAGAAARLVGVSLEDTIALITLLAKNGLRGSDAGTSLRTAFLALANPTKKAQQLIKALNLQIEDFQGNLRPEVFAEFAAATSNLGNVQRAAAAKIIFGADAIRAAGLAGLEGVEGLDAMRASTGEAGLAAKIAGARTRGLAGDVGALTSNLETLGTTLGGTVTPILSSFTKGLNFAVGAINALIANPLPISPQIQKAEESFESLSKEIAETQRQIASFGRFIPPALTEKLAELQARQVEVRGGMRDMNLGLAEFISRAEKAAAAASRLIDAIGALGREAAEAQAELLRLQTEGGTRQQQIGVLEGIITTQRDIIAGAKAAGGEGSATAIRKARLEIKSAQAEIATLQAGIVADAKKAADAAEKRRNEQDEAVRRQFEAISRPIERLLDRAALTTPLKDDIKFTTQLIQLYKKQIEQAAKRIQDVETRNQVLKTLGEKLFQAILDRRRLARDERRRILEALQERQERIIRGTELDIELADINENTRRRIALRLKLIAQLKREAKILKLTENALKENRNEIARINKEIEDIRKEQKDTGKSFQELTFEFLQTQQGFAANLFGNLIPGGSTGGLVGNVSPAAQRPEITVQQEAAIASSRELGVSRGQGNETNQLLRQILRALENLNGRAGHPEARYQRSTQSAFMDVIGT